MMNLIEQLKEHEGFESNFYQCSANKKTIGYGRNVECNPFTAEEISFLGRTDFEEKPLTEEEAEYLLVNDVNKVTSEVKDCLPWDALNSARKAVCVNMAFNLGFSGFMKFKNMHKAITGCLYEQAAHEMLNSRWARQVKGRANQLAVQMATGEWQ